MVPVINAKYNHVFSFTRPQSMQAFLYVATTCCVFAVYINCTFIRYYICLCSIPKQSDLQTEAKSQPRLYFLSLFANIMLYCPSYIRGHAV